MNSPHIHKQVSSYMMRNTFIAFSLLASAHSQAKQFTNFEIIGETKGCAPLSNVMKNHLQWDIVSVPKEINAGQQLSGVIKFTKNFQLSETDWFRKYSDFSIRLAIDQPYPHIFHSNPSSNFKDFLFEATNDLELFFSYDIPLHIGGNFQIQLSILFYGKNPDTHMCMLIGRFDQEVNILSDDIHMLPPLLRSLTVDKTFYTAGEYVTAQLTLSSPLDSLDTDHFEWINPAVPQGNEDRGFPEFEYNVFRRFTLNDDGSYTILVKIPRWVKPGRYYLKYFNRQNKYKNFESEVGIHDAEELRVSQSSPLIVK